MPKLGTVLNSEGELHFMCPACGCAHRVFVIKRPDTPCWKWNNDIDKPTFQPSLRVQSGDENGDTMCHSFITDGKIRFLNDCTHHLKGKTVEIPEW